MQLDLRHPARSIRPSHRSLTGKVALHTGRMAAFESSLERDWIISLDFDRRVGLIVEQPYTIYYFHDGARRRYTPDLLAQFGNGEEMQTVVYEVKPHQELRRRWSEFRPRFKAALLDCRHKGWRFRIVTERHIRTPYLDNAKFLRRYETIPDEEMHRAALLHTLRVLGKTTPQALIAASWNSFDRQAAALAQLWRMICVGDVVACLTRPLTMTSPIWLP